MTTNLRTFIASAIVSTVSIVVVIVACPALAQDVSPGAACSVAGAFTRSGGPELSGAGHFMVCSGSVWTSALSYSSTGNTLVPGALSLTGDIAPTAIGATQNDYAPTGYATAGVLRLTANAAYNITGLQGGADGRVLMIMNVGSNTITLKNQDAASTAANRFAFGADVVLAADKTVGLIYDTTSQRWRAGGLPFEVAWTGPPDCPDIGDLCTSGVVFAGWHPVFHYQIFIPPTDQARPGSPGVFTMNWKNAIGTNDISTDSDNDGEINHANRGGAISAFPAFQACEDLVFGGYGDWYLPSRVEIYYIWAVRGAIEAGGNITNFQNVPYWSSSEYDTTYAWFQFFDYGTNDLSDKNLANRVRCVRR